MQNKSHKKWMALAFSALLGALFSFLLMKFVFKKKPVIETAEDRLSYVLGQQMGANFKKQGITVNPATLALSIEEAISSKSPRMTETEMQQSLLNYHQRIAKNDPSKTSGPETNAHPSPVKVIKLVTGHGKSPKPHDIVKISYLILNTEKSETLKPEKATTLELPLNNLPRGMMKVLLAMNEGDKIKAHLPQELLQNSPLQLPSSGAEVQLEIELLKVTTRGKK